MELSGQVHFDGWTLLQPSGELLREGRRTRLQDQPLHILVALLEQPGELVPRERLIARLWPKQVVDYDAALNAAVRRLRAALGDEAETPRYIETVPRRGYRFIAQLDRAPPPEGSRRPTVAAAPPAVAVRRHRAPLWILVLLAVLAGAWLLARNPAGEGRSAVVATGPQSIVVLPLVSLTPGEAAQELADGLTEELILRLTAIHGLRVIARTSSFALRDDKRGIRAIARQLDVSHVLEGSVRRSADRIRVTAQLIDAATSVQLWSSSYDRTAGDAIAIQDDIAVQVARALEIRFAAPLGTTPRPNAAAADQYLLARHLFGRRGPGDVERARSYFNKAVELDPAFARAWAGLASSALILTFEGKIGRADGIAEVRHAAGRAIALDPTLAEPHFRLAMVARFTGDRETAHAQQEMAIELEPDYPLGLVALADEARDEGRIDESFALHRRLISLDPLSTVYRGNYAWELFTAGRYEAALAEMHKLVALYPDTRREVECQSLVMLGRFDEARASAGGMSDPDRSLQCLALAEHGRGDRAASDAALAELAARSPDNGAFMIAEVHAYRGEVSEAFEWLRRNDAWCPTSSGQMEQCFANVVERSPFLATLHEDARWQAIVPVRPAAP